MTAKESTEEASPSQDATVDLEMDELNQHECMAAVTALIGHMHRNGITPKIEEVSGEGKGLRVLGQTTAPSNKYIEIDI